MTSRAERPPGVEWAVISVVAAAVVLGTVAVFLVGLDALAGGFVLFDARMLGLCVLLLAWQLACRFSRWYLFMRSLGLRLRAGEAALYYAAGMSMTLTPGRIGEALRLWFLEKHLAAPYRRTAGLYVADRAADLMAYLIMLAVGSLGFAQGAPLAWGASLLVVAAILALMKPRLLIAVVTAVYARVGRGRAALLWVRRALRNTATIFQPRIFIPGVLIGTIGWLAAPALLWLSLAQLGAAVDPLRAILIYGTAAIAGGSTMMPAGGGATETVLVLLLKASSISLESAVTAMIMTRIAFLFMPVGIGILVLPLAMKQARKAMLGHAHPTAGPA